MSGYEKLGDILKWCKRLPSIHTVTVFAFAIDNFKRSPDEVTCLMGLAHEKFEEMIHGVPSIIDEHRLVVRVLGRLDLLPHHVRQSALRVMHYSESKYGSGAHAHHAHHECGNGDSRDGGNSSEGRKSLVLNLCFAYSASDEMIQSITNQTLHLASDYHIRQQQLSSSSSSSSSYGDNGDSDENSNESDDHDDNVDELSSRSCSSGLLNRKRNCRSASSPSNNMHQEDENNVCESTNDKNSDKTAQRTTIDRQTLPMDDHNHHSNYHHYDHSFSSSSQQSQPQSPHQSPFVSVETMTQNMRTCKSPNPDLVIRTSGEIRLSDFLTWQCSNDSMLFFSRVMWPDFSLWNFLNILLRYQMGHGDLVRYRQSLNRIDQRTKYRVPSPTPSPTYSTATTSANGNR